MSRSGPAWVLFDLDMTLVDHESAFVRGTAAICQASAIRLPETEFFARWSEAHRRNFDLFLNGALTFAEQRRARVRDTVEFEVSDDEAERLFAIYIATYEEGWTLFPDVLPCLDALAGRNLGVITNGQSAQQRLKLERTGIARRFGHVTVSDECGKPKPHAEVFAYACRGCGADPRNVVYVGDHYDIDAVGARQAGLTGIWLDRAGARSAVHAGPTIRSLSELPALLERLGR